jgi:peptide methionine sulfoxide reductase MsrB
MTNSALASRADRIAKTDAEWRTQLTPEQHYVTRDGPSATTGRRDCINGAALTFKPGGT